MKFIALIIAISLLQYWGSASPVHKDDWYRTLVAKLNSSGLELPWQLALAVLLPAALVIWVLGMVSGALFGLLTLAITVLLLLYSFGRHDFEALVGRYRGYCLQGDYQGAYLFASETMTSEADEPCPNSPERLHRWVKERICYLGFERWFGVIFFFAIFGVGGALAYRLLHLFGECGDDPVRKQLLRKVLPIVDWVPVRLLVFAFAVTGDWVASREQLMRSLQDTETPAAEVIADAAHASLGLKTTVFSADGAPAEVLTEVGDWEIGQIQALLSRSAVAWVVVLSALVLFI